MNKTYTCAICGKTINNLDDYLKHVAACGAKEKKAIDDAAKLKRLEEINAAINKVKSAKAYYEECRKEFAAKYPEEYKTNFLFKSEISDTLANDTEDVSDVVGFYQFLQMLSDIWDQIDDEPKKTN